ncbi:hypothetical protein BCR44DRAFT_1426912 [Catenaria anguillulae PL171]|uniref:Uncharacterized protein n=1 Tax=Catenaria anguillulae PL171 TaxID=765915 RepID=A0A1Y2HYD4_9FUNG|nr:hypothetical protein BCR44DRAFT_1426912 [Catenaria anguillulae PL171]
MHVRPLRLERASSRTSYETRRRPAWLPKLGWTSWRPSFWCPRKQAGRPRHGQTSWQPSCVLRKRKARLPKLWHMIWRPNCSTPKMPPWQLKARLAATQGELDKAQAMVEKLQVEKSTVEEASWAALAKAGSAERELKAEVHSLESRLAEVQVRWSSKVDHSAYAR